MLPDDRTRIASYYDRLVDEFGHDPRACDASSRESLLVRYRALSQVLDLSGRSVLEVGCGFGDFGHFLQLQHSGLLYTGIDISGKMIAVGRQLYPDHRLLHGDVLDMGQESSYDIVMAQGIFYLLGEGAESKMAVLIAKMFSLAREAVAFSTLSSWSPRQEPAEFYAEPLALLTRCRQLTPYVVLRHDYHPGDMAVYLYKRPIRKETLHSWNR